ncbi:RdgB/HAM1 family non-canonical purine NTP pyrophosphatase [Pelagicoccus sp. SDUM812005]|uniref:RdgB/HAM1 family non-canonical purine NTP pyrophosphatase n=1 Tax=Pelagicoccus sp. SDUM812005 TaxID=3041257 RepID=UPI00280ED4B1|nr:RdgB/HAM1 family non-canonical purine NTP pyrophosphatase [Pelagicoccus sp. SDUM812005]MDQ8182156.1 RdgB/HAM1 family non-canonical purine NTP pyrophosphatase [Pelagicoccus sp. SDUM812005]
MKLYLATGNAHKIEELRAMLAAAGLAMEVHGPAALGGMPEVVEDQDSFSGNALKKARALATRLPSGACALADDSGLCVDALDGAPGVYSARYAGEGASDAENTDKLLKSLEALGAVDRSAGFQCHLALVSATGEEQIFAGECRGRIIEAKQGEGGFGYDPVFVPDGFSKTFAELSRSEKAGLSHRGKAMEQLVAWLRSKGA